MLINCHVTPKAKCNQVSQITQNLYKIKTTAPATNNLANQAVLKLLADHFKIKKSQIWLKAGQTSREKVFEIVK